MNLPNQLSLLRILLTPGFVICFFVNRFGFQIGAFGIYTLASLTDWYDGYIARKEGLITTWGQFLDPLADKVLVSSALICFSAAGYVPDWMVLIIVMRDLLMTAIRSYSLMNRIPFKTNFFAKSKTAGQMVAIYFIFIVHLMTWKIPIEERGIFFRTLEDWSVIPYLVGLITLATILSFVVYVFENKYLMRRLLSDTIWSFVRKV